MKGFLNTSLLASASSLATSAALSEMVKQQAQLNVAENTAPINVMSILNAREYEPSNLGFYEKCKPYVKGELTPERNSKCPCGSQMKYKKCCGK